MIFGSPLWLAALPPVWAVLAWRRWRGGNRVHAIGIDRAPGYQRGELGDAFAGLDELVPSPGFGWVSLHPTDRYRWPLVPGLLALGTSLVLSHTWLRRGP
ncbi:MAG: hypothetical protein R3F61_30960 [Myxococcota bacterium]